MQYIFILLKISTKENVKGEVYIIAVIIEIICINSCEKHHFHKISLSIPEKMSTGFTFCSKFRLRRM